MLFTPMVENQGYISMYQKESPMITSSFSKVSIFRDKKKQKHPIQTKKETKTPYPDKKNTDRNEDSEVINADEALK